MSYSFTIYSMHGRGNGFNGIFTSKKMESRQRPPLGDREIEAGRNVTL